MYIHRIDEGGSIIRRRSHIIFPVFSGMMMIFSLLYASILTHDGYSALVWLGTLLDPILMKLIPFPLPGHA